VRTEDPFKSKEGDMMNEKKPRSHTNILLFVLFGITLMSLVGMIGETGTPHPGAGVHFHAFAGFVMTVVTFFHMRHHWRWFRAAMMGKLKGKAFIRLAMNTMVFVFMIVACLSGFSAMNTPGINMLHAVVGTVVVLGLAVHCAKKLRVMARSAALKG
jgi:cation transport ATPase